jgi:hypothetical protein
MMAAGETHGSVTGYFREREEVSALYTCLTCSLARRRTELAVLLRDAGLSAEEMETLREGYSVAVSEIVSGDVEGAVLNSLEPGRRQEVLTAWQLLFDRNNNYLAWFMRATREEAGPVEDGVPGAETEPVDEVSEAVR